MDSPSNFPLGNLSIWIVKQKLQNWKVWWSIFEVFFISKSKFKQQQQQQQQKQINAQKSHETEEKHGKVFVIRKQWTRNSKNDKNLAKMANWQLSIKKCKTKQTKTPPNNSTELN